MLMKPASRPVAAHFRHAFSKFLADESGAMAIFGIFIFFLMLVFGGIAVDVMRAETRRVELSQTQDRIALAASSLRQERDPQTVAEDWWRVAGLYKGKYARFDAPELDITNTAGLRRVTVKSKVRSYNHFMHMLQVDHLDAPSMSEAAQGVSQIEVMMVLDITGSMNSPASSGGSTKIQDLRAYASEFVDIVKANDSRNGVSIGLVPYAAQVNIPANLRNQFTVSRLSHWGGSPNQGVPNINCIEMPTSSYASVGLSQTTTMAMAAVADTNSTTTNTTNFVTPGNGRPVGTGRICTTVADNLATPANEETFNHVFLPTKDGEAVKTRIARLTANGNTSIALGMRWGTALIDESARPIYAAIGDGSVQGRPADNPATAETPDTRKIIILMTDGSHVSNSHVYDTFKTGPSPIFVGADGNFAIRYTTGGAALTGGTRPGSGTTSTTSCSGWQLSNYANREYFVPHLKRNSVRQRVGADTEGNGTGADTTGACDPRAWIAPPPNSTTAWWTGSGTTLRQLDWSEVWALVRVSWVARQLYNRSGVGGTGNYDTVMNQFRGTYLSVSNMNNLLQENCAAAKAAGIEIYGIAFAAPAAGQTQIQGCSTNIEKYYFDAQNGAELRSAFNLIATDISELRLTQ
jgi:Flp pilus assembly protein TadG